MLQDRFGARVLFALQCGASIGTIEDLVVLSSQPLPAGRASLRGTYKQKVGGGLRAFGLQSPDILSGVFDATVNDVQDRIEQISWKISVRSGEVPQTCIR